MTDYYGKITLKSICADVWFVSGIYSSGEAKSNDLEIARNLNTKLPELVGQTTFYTYDLRKGKGK
jgi:hypothetical protein